jgi:hypothetical protein
MKTWLEEFIENEAGEVYCPCCLQRKGGSDKCCSDNSKNFFVRFADLDYETQRKVAEEEWNWAFKDSK